MPSTMTPEQRASYVALLERELQNAHLAWILDDAVMGGGLFYELLADYGLDPENRGHRAILRDAVDRALAEGF